MVETRSSSEALVRRAIEQLANGFPPCGSLLARDVRWHEPGRSMVAGDYVGCDEVAGSLFARLRELSDGSFRILEWDGVTVDDGREVAMYVVRARRGGRDLLSRDLCVAEIRDGSIVAARVYHGDQHAWDRFWS
jgi:ketosteroid isomerase-like protein